MRSNRESGLLQKDGSSLAKEARQQIWAHLRITEQTGGVYTEKFPSDCLQAQTAESEGWGRC